MNKNVKKMIEEGRINDLQFYFILGLDSDPTFDLYREEYEKCKALEGFFKEYEELTPLSDESKDWNEDYWAQLKVDLSENFSSERFTHAIKVVQYYKADKVKQLKAERKERERREQE